jgi:3-deoxy-manno-octulosonate cytidylyltransferase (CMP-KDO synthetase)
VYTRAVLLGFPLLRPTPGEQRERLEQLRLLEHGIRIKVVETPDDSIGVDTPEDLARAEAALRRGLG